jgi:DNA adenine methylase
MKPPFAYYGGKTTLAERIAATFPPHGHYVEPFAGSLSVLLAKPPARMETVNDLDQDIVTFWRVLRERPTELIRACALTPHSRAEHIESRRRPASLDDIERARRIWVDLTQGRAGSLRKTGWRYYIDPNASSTSMPGYLAGYVERMPPAVQRLLGVSLECRPALEIIEAYGAYPDVLLYVDPPYLRSTRTSRQYAEEMSTPAEHRELAAALRSCRATVVLSGYPSPLYDELYGDWHRTSFAVSTREGVSKAARTEVLWSNRAPVADLFAEEAS